MKTLTRFLALCLLALPLAAFADIPPLNGNAWNIVFVQSFEANANTNNLSAKGFNHALLFGQLLNSVTAGKIADIQGIYSFSPNSNAQDMTTLQSIEPFAVLNNRAVTHKLVGSGDITQYGTAAYIINGILSDQPRGTYVIAMPAAMINDTLANLLGPNAPTGGVTPGNYKQYVVLALANGRMSAVVYDDGLKPDDRYPDLNVKHTPKYACPEQPVKFTVKKPKASQFQFNTKQTVYFVRHVEAHPNSTFENGNFVCQGAWRAIGANDILRKMMGGKPKNIFTTNPANIIGCAGTCSYIRPALTIAPFAIQHDQNLMLAGFQWNDAPTLAASLFTRNTPYSSEAFDKSLTLVAWEHEHIELAVQYLIGTLYKAPASVQQLPNWSFTDYDTVWKLETDEHGDLTFSNSCEGIDSNSLPSTCPAFPVGAK
ncbi:MAG: hypothetical protein HY850_09305 [Betaproteobacteria bacterium]|nr:hypothetical protein [Betaproteobacteria bacterium]